ncbi:MAG: endonuclease III domain-containing protein [Candidatus Thiodiazotropha sp. (ex Epidulcina cf. delphinae)]|nr:endonuclease III domain-containing protein [Candidatus Thiodiazotropha sp. (ex Epidulcina cf. delphinae)]
MLTIYRQLLDQYGRQHWWPAETPFEVMVGAVLTQNTAWTNVEKAIDNLKADGRLALDSMLSMSQQALADAIRPAGYFNVKAKRLLSLCRFLERNPGLERLDSGLLRSRLLSVHGVGPETADDILLYAFNRPVFVVDAYTRRLFSRLGVIEPDIGYERLRQGFEQALGRDVRLFNEYHALIVAHGKSICRPRALCRECVLERHCLHACASPDISPDR